MEREWDIITSALFMKNEYLIFPALGESWFAINHSYINKVLFLVDSFKQMFLLVQNKLVPSANII